MRKIILAILIALVIPTTAHASATIFTATLDTYADAQKPTKNFGTATTMIVDGSPTRRTFVRFPAVPAGATSATLRLYNTGTALSGSATVNDTDEAWTETGLTWNNQPAIFAQQGSVPNIVAGYNNITIPTSVLFSDRTNSFAVQRTNSTQVNFAARQTSTPAQLIVTYPDQPPPGFNPPNYAGSDYVGPEHSAMPGVCSDHYNWAKVACWGSYESARLQKDIDYIGANRLGKFQRLWISIDQLFSCFNATTGYCGYDSGALANLDAALHKFAAAGMQVDLVLLANGNQNGFHFEALDGSHAAMRANYLTAVADLLNHVEADSLDVQATAVVDLMNEAYYQSEVRGLNDTVIHQWLNDLYGAAKAAAPGLLYTISDTGRLYRDQATWVPMYPVDVYDIHSYDNNPEANRADYANAANLQKPWFVGEAGCGSGNTACTYGAGSDVQAIDTWWLNNLRTYGAKAVLIEDKGTLFTRSDPTYQLKPVGQIVQSYNP